MSFPPAHRIAPLFAIGAEAASVWAAKSSEPSARTAKTSAEGTYRRIRKLQRPPYGTIHRFVKIISQPYFFKLGARFSVPPPLGWRLAQGRLCSRPLLGAVPHQSREQRRLETFVK